jgi:hypothetical protein
VKELVEIILEQLCDLLDKVEENEHSVPILGTLVEKLDLIILCNILQENNTFAMDS